MYLIFKDKLKKHTAVVYNAKMYIFGGCKSISINTNDLWEYDFK